MAEVLVHSFWLVEPEHYAVCDIARLDGNLPEQMQRAGIFVDFRKAGEH